MEKESYLLFQDEKHIYSFVSEGKNGNIIKTVIFQELESEVYNLVLADYNPNTHLLNDNSISNNNDITKIMATVVKVILLFFDSEPNASIYIQANTKQKNLLYNRIFKNYFNEITSKFIVKGQNESILDNYVLGKSYESFYICLIKS